MRSILWGWIKALLFRLDAERAHRLTVFLIRLGNLLGGVPLRIAAGAGAFTAALYMVKLEGITA